MARFAKDLRTDTLAIGVLHALTWYIVYPYFINFLQVATAPPYLEAQRNPHSWFWPGGLALVSVVLSFVSATVTFLVLRPMKGAP